MLPTSAKQLMLLLLLNATMPAHGVIVLKIGERIGLFQINRLISLLRQTPFARNVHLLRRLEYFKAPPDVPF